MSSLTLGQAPETEHWDIHRPSFATPQPNDLAALAGFGDGRGNLVGGLTQRIVGQMGVSLRGPRLRVAEQAPDQTAGSSPRRRRSPRKYVADRKCGYRSAPHARRPRSQQLRNCCNGRPGFWPGKT